MNDLDTELLQKLQAAEPGHVTLATLHTDDRVLARISDGIYRRPSSAIRELVANSYDADATQVIIRTDAPRFSEISVRDNGIGMTHETLVRLINHIGGSAKRTQDGSRLGVASADDPALSPAGRRLIGKIGIGLFSVAQLTRTFTIISKRAGADNRIIAKVHLRTYSEDELAIKPEDEVVTTGSVAITTVPAEDKDSQGTEILLYDLHPAARDMLRSSEQWALVGREEADGGVDEYRPPTYHIGWLKNPTDVVYETNPNLPWLASDDASAKFRKLYDAVVAELDTRTSRPKLTEVFDEYLRTLWTISLSVPLGYLDGTHPFDLKASDDPRFFMLSNKAGASAAEIELAPDSTLRRHVGLEAPFVGESSTFDIYFDDVQLSRPLRFNGLPRTDLADARATPLMFVGKYKAPLGTIEADVSGGKDLEFEGYLLWTKKVVPTEHIGLLVRIADASGTLFDESFLGYQVQELTRLAQISAEIFVKRGLDAALNIDRESFNFGHPHAKIVAAWVHRALRQLATTQKRLAKEERDKQRVSDTVQQISAIQNTVRNRVEALKAELPSVRVVAAQGDLESARSKAEITISREQTLRHLPERPGAKQKQEREFILQKVAAIAQLLEAFGLLQNLDYVRQEELMAAIAEIVGETHD